jgi:glycosyltransferase involved in cell wall biosynthesis
MEILFDYRLVQKYYPRGVYQFGSLLLKYLLIQIEAEKYCDTITLLIESKLPYEFTGKEKYLECITINEFLPNRFFDVFFNTSTIVLNLRSIETIDYLYPDIVVRNCKKIACKLHDFVPLLIREYIPDQISKINYALQLEAIKKCDYVFTNSLYTAKSANKYLGIPLDRLVIIFGMINENYIVNSFFKEYNAFGKKNMVISILGYCSRKNAQRLVEAWCIAKKNKSIPSDACLYIVSYFEGREELHNICKARDVPIKSVKIPDYLPIEDLIVLLSKSRGSIFPSYLEGLGLPILESYAVGTPCFAANTSSTKELVNSESTFDPFDLDSMTSAIDSIFNNEMLCRRNLEFGRELLKTIDNKKIAKKILEKLHE